MSYDAEVPEVPQDATLANPWARAERRRQALTIPTPTIAQAFTHIVRTVAEADRRGIKSPTIEAMRVLTARAEGSPAA